MGSYDETSWIFREDLDTKQLVVRARYRDCELPARYWDDKWNLDTQYPQYKEKIGKYFSLKHNKTSGIACYSSDSITSIDFGFLVYKKYIKVEHQKKCAFTSYAELFTTINNSWTEPTNQIRLNKLKFCDLLYITNLQIPTNITNNTNKLIEILSYRENNLLPTILAFKSRNPTLEEICDSYTITRELYLLLDVSV